MNYRYNAWLFIAVFSPVLFIQASSMITVAGSQRVHEINEKIQKLRQRYDQLGKQIEESKGKLDDIVKNNKDNKELMDRLEGLVYYFNKVEKLEAQKMDQLDKLILKDSSYAQSDDVRKRRVKKINKLDDTITHQYNVALFSYYGSYGPASEAVKTKMKIHEDMMARYEVARDIKRNVELYKSMISSSRLNQREEGVSMMSDEDDELGQVDSKRSTLKYSRTYSK